MSEKLSIIIPIFNEEENIKPLTERIVASLQDKYIFELIFIDDRSTDWSLKTLLELSKEYPEVFFYEKKGQKGKAFSILEGIKYARYETIVMIDGDLQYPPEAIPAMVAKLNSWDEIVVANRKEQGNGILRKIASKTFSFICVKLLHNFDIDAQSGLKVFRKEIFERITVTPTPWTFDLEFLVKARQAGYKVIGHDIIFSKRNAGKSKIGLIRSSYEIGVGAMKLKFLRPVPIRFSNRAIQQEGDGFHYKQKKFLTYTSLSLKETAFKNLTSKQRYSFMGVFALSFAGVVFDWRITMIAIMSFMTLIYISDFIFNLFLIYRSFIFNPEIKVPEDKLADLNYSELPIYTIFCPLYKEWQVVPQFVEAMEKLDYPQDKLQVLLLLEADDKKTIEKVRQYALPANFETHIVPKSAPKTKPKALNYGLRKIKGEFAVIYDAEDIPESLQLKKAVAAFRKLDEKVICLQAKLNFFNPQQNLLTKLFTSEYSLWFDLILTGLQSINAPIPLGGTSNHFRTSYLKSLKGWDAFNVTEDCDLGIRLFKQGYKTQILDSTTYEEANSRWFNWLSQRSRWIKGYIQTYLVHTRNIEPFIKSDKRIHFFTFQLVVGGKILTTFINPFMWLITVLYFVYRPQLGSAIESFFPGPIFYMGVLSFVFGNFLYLYCFMIGSARRGYFGLVKYALAVPFYWLSMSVAGWMAVYSLLIKPHYWAKTTHGYHLHKNKSDIYNASIGLANSIYAYGEKAYLPVQR